MTDNDTVRVAIWQDAETGDFDFYIDGNPDFPGAYTFDLDRSVLDGWTAVQQAWQGMQEDLTALYRARAERLAAHREVDRLRAAVAEAQANLDAHLAQTGETE